MCDLVGAKLSEFKIWMLESNVLQFLYFNANKLCIKSIAGKEYCLKKLHGEWKATSKKFVSDSVTRELVGSLTRDDMKECFQSVKNPATAFKSEISYSSMVTTSTALTIDEKNYPLPPAQNPLFKAVIY